MLRLDEEGRLGLDDVIARWLPDVPGSREITVRQLLSHTSGLVWDRGSEEAWLHDVVGRPGVAVAADDPLHKPPREAARPGSAFRYENGNYELLARIAEQVSREGLARSIRSRFLDPLGLSRTFVQPDERPAPPIAHGYRRRCRVRWSCSRVLSSAKADYIDVTEGGGGYLPALSVVSFLPASGGMASTPSDLARWAGALWGGRVLGQASTATMLTVSSASTTAHDRPEAGYGLGVVRSDPDGQPLWNHGGGLDGFQTFVGYLPQRQVSFAVAVNTSANSLIVGELVQALLGRLGIKASRPIVA